MVLFWIYLLRLLLLVIINSYFGELFPKVLLFFTVKSFIRLLSPVIPCALSYERFFKKKGLSFVLTRNTKNITSQKPKHSNCAKHKSHVANSQEELHIQHPAFLFITYAAGKFFSSSFLHWRHSPLNPEVHNLVIGLTSHYLALIVSRFHLLSWH